MTVSPKSGARRGSKYCYTYYDVLKWGIRFTLGANTAKNIDCIKNCFNKSCSELNFLQKPNVRVCLSSPGVELGAPKIDMFVMTY